jgi:hypothetical protein
LGRYRISSTRGGGFLNVFFADNCHTDTTHTHDPPPKDADMETQKKKYLDTRTITQAVLNGKFKEAKWTQTISMTLLWLNEQEKERLAEGEKKKEKALKEDRAGEGVEK